MMIIAGSWYVADKVGRLHSLTTVLGKESLCIYVVHLLVLYGSAINPAWNLRSMIAGTMDASATFGLTFAFILAMLMLAVIWHYLKSKQVAAYSVLQLTITAILLFYFFTNDY